MSDDEEFLSSGDEAIEFVSSSTPQRGNAEPAVHGGRTGVATVVTDEDEPPPTLLSFNSEKDASVQLHQIGTRVQVRWQGKDYAAVVQKLSPRGTYDVTFEIDGSKGTNLNHVSHKLLPLPPKVIKKAIVHREVEIETGEEEEETLLDDENSMMGAQKRKRGRPKGSKNRPKEIYTSAGQRMRLRANLQAVQEMSSASPISIPSTFSDSAFARTNPSPLPLQQQAAVQEGVTTRVATVSPPVRTKRLLEARPGEKGRYRAVCMTLGCNAFAKKAHMCVAHGPRCAHPGCNTGINARGLCATHKRLYEKNGTLPPVRRAKQKAMHHHVKPPPPPPRKKSMVSLTTKKKITLY